MANKGRLFNTLMNGFLSKNESPQGLKSEIVRTIMKLPLAYPCESWPLTERLKSKFNSTEMRF